MKGYKAFYKDLTCRGFQFEVGKEYKHTGKIKPCESGFHFCKSLADCYNFYSMSEDTRICEVEALGEVMTDDEIKYVTNHIKILEEVKNPREKSNLSKSSSGYCNSGYWNSGYWNSGNRNSGNSNSGNRNSGNRNSGNKNSGYCNSGNRNSGDCNSGNRNSGYCNSGNRNSGNWNSGDWNSGNWNSGVFNTNKEPRIFMFDKLSDWTIEDWNSSDARDILSNCPYSYSNFVYASDMTDEEKANHPEHKTIGGYIKVYTVTKADKQKWWDELDENDKQTIHKLPNYDEDKFIECVGIEHI